MARTVYHRRKYRNRGPLIFAINLTYKARLAEKYKAASVIPIPADSPPNCLCVPLEFSQSSKEDILPPPPPTKPHTRSSSKISSQDAFEDTLAKISHTPSQRSKKGILQPAFNRPCTRSRSKIPGSAK